MRLRHLEQQDVWLAPTDSTTGIGSVVIGDEVSTDTTAEDVP